MKQATDILTITLFLTISFLSLVTGTRTIKAQSTDRERIVRLESEQDRAHDRDTAALQRVEQLEKRVDDMRDLMSRVQGMILMLSLLSGICALVMLIRVFISKNGKDNGNGQQHKQNES